MTDHPLVARYFAAMRARDLTALRALFAPDAIVALPNGRTFEGWEAIEQMFAGLFVAAAPSPTCLRQIVGDQVIATEIETDLPDGGVRRTANFFDLDERGSITGLRSYMRS